MRTGRAGSPSTPAPAGADPHWRKRPETRPATRQRSRVSCWPRGNNCSARCNFLAGREDSPQDDRLVVRMTRQAKIEGGTPVEDHEDIGTETEDDDVQAHSLLDNKTEG